MTKRLIDVDDQVLERAREMLDGATIKDTVNTALQEFCDRDTRVRLFAHIQRLAAGDLGDPEVMKLAQRQWPEPFAAVAEVNDLTVLHYDKDFDIISQATSQPTEWVVPRGSL